MKMLPPIIVACKLTWNKGWVKYTAEGRFEHMPFFSLSYAGKRSAYIAWPGGRKKRSQVLAKI